MSATFAPLRIPVAVPCQVSWDGMRGDGPVRFCRQCQQQVYNLSEMERSEVDALLSANGGRSCVRFFQRPDGTVMTRDCHSGSYALCRRCDRAVMIGAALLLGIGSYFGLVSSTADRPAFLRDIEPFRTVLERISPSPPAIMGR